MADAPGLMQSLCAGDSDLLGWSGVCHWQLNQFHGKRALKFLRSEGALIFLNKKFCI